MQLKTVIFDLDDTLYTDWRTCDDAGTAAVAEYAQEELGLPAEAATRAFRAGRRRAQEQLGPVGAAHDRTLFAQFGLEELGINPIAHCEAMHDAYWNRLLDTMVLEPALPALLKDLRAAGVCIAVCTNMMAGVQMRKLIRLGLADSIDYMVTSEEAGMDKPNPAIVTYTLRKAGCAPAEAVFVGDTYGHDMVAAHGAGVRGLWLDRRGAGVPKGQPTPDWIDPSMHEAAAHLRALLTQEKG